MNRVKYMVIIDFQILYLKVNKNFKTNYKKNTRIATLTTAKLNRSDKQILANV